MMRRIKDYNEEWLGDQRPGRLLWKVLGAGLAVAVVLVLAALEFGWFKTATDVISPTNVKAQWQFAYDYTESLNAIGSNWCAIKHAEDGAVGDDKTQRTSQRLAIELNYDRVKGEYDGRLRDAFRARLVRPPDVPDRAPTLQQTVASLACG